MGYATLEKSKLRLPRFLGQAFLWFLGVQFNINVKFVVGAVLVRFDLLLICSFQKFTCLEPKTMSLKLFSDFYKIQSYTDHSSMLTMQTKSEEKKFSLNGRLGLVSTISTYVTLVGDQNDKSWSLLAKESNANIGKLRTHFFCLLFYDFCLIKQICF